MSVIEALEAQVNAGHKDTDLVGVPVSMIRVIAQGLRKLEAAEAQMHANTAINQVCQEIAR